MFSTLQPYIEYRGINNPLICVSALKHSPSKRKSITRPLRPLDGDFDSTGESIRSIEYLGNFLFFFFEYLLMIDFVCFAWSFATGSTICGLVRWLISCSIYISFYIYLNLFKKRKISLKKLSIHLKYKLNRIYVNILSL